MPSFDTPQPVDIRVDLGAGQIRVDAADRTDTVATVEPTDPSKAADVAAADGTRVDCVDGRLVISAPKGWRRFTPFDDSGSVRVTVEAPSGSRLDASTSLGDIRVEGELDQCRVKTAMGNVRLDRSGDLSLKTGFGDVDVDAVHGDADITTGSGDVRVRLVDGATTVKNANGATALGHVTGDVRVKAANGRIAIEQADRSVAARSAAGAIDVGSVRRGVATLETAVGDVSCGLAAGTAASLDVRSKFGRVHSGLDAGDGPAAGEEVVELHAHTSVGDITLFRAGTRESA